MGASIDPEELTWRQFRGRAGVVEATRMNVPFRVETAGGWVAGVSGDWLIEVGSEMQTCRDDVFRARYTEVEDGGEDAG